MKVYEWQETDTHYIAIMRPKELFDLSTLENPNPEDHEARLMARHLLTGEMEGFAMAYGKGWRYDFTQAHMQHLRDNYLQRDIADLKKIKFQQRKTA